MCSFWVGLAVLSQYLSREGDLLRVDAGRHRCRQL